MAIPIESEKGIQSVASKKHRSHRGFKEISLLLSVLFLIQCFFISFVYANGNKYRDADEALLREVSILKRLASKKSSIGAAIVLTERKLYGLSPELQKRHSCILWNLLGNMEYPGQKNPSSSILQQIVEKTKISRSLGWHQRTLNTWDRKVCRDEDLRFAIKRTLSLKILTEKLSDVLSWYEDLRLESRYSDETSASILDNEFISWLRTQKSIDAGTTIAPLLLASIRRLVNSNKSDQSNTFARETDTLIKNPEAEKAINQYTAFLKIPKSKPLVSAIVLASIWTVIALFIWLMFRLSPETSFDLEFRYALWQMSPEWSDAPEPAELAPDTVIRYNEDRKWALFREFCFYRYDPLAYRFTMNSKISMHTLIVSVISIGFGSLVALNFVEKTLNSSPHVKLSFWGSLADPFNWAVAVPFFFVFSRLLYSYIPYSINYFYENILHSESPTIKERLLKIVDKWLRYYNRRIITPILLFAAFVGSAVGLIDLAQHVSIYGFEVIQPSSLLSPLLAVMYRVPTFLGLYTILILTILIYAILRSALVIIITIFLFRDIYDEMQDDLQLNPFHTDCCGGMSFAGNLALRMILVVSVAGLMGFDLVLRDVFIANRTAQLYHWMIFPLYVIIFPITFFMPVLDARKVLIVVRELVHERINEMARSVFAEIRTWNQREQNRGRPKNIMEISENITKLREVAEHELPVWPIQINQITGFITAFILPILVPILLERLIG